MEETETITIKNTEIKCQRILYELQNITRVRIPIIKGMTNKNIIIFLLYDSKFPWKIILVSLLEKYQVNERALLLEVSVRLYPPRQELKFPMKREASMLPYFQKLEEKNNHYWI